MPAQELLRAIAKGMVYRDGELHVTQFVRLIFVSMLYYFRKPAKLPSRHTLAHKGMHHMLPCINLIRGVSKPVPW